MGWFIRWVSSVFVRIVWFNVVVIFCTNFIFVLNSLSLVKCCNGVLSSVFKFIFLRGH